MARAPALDSPAEQLSAVLTAAAARKSVSTPMVNNDDCFDDAELAAAAVEDEKRRAEFDRILETSNSDWNKIDDPAALKSALTTLLTEIRGPAIETVGPHPISAGLSLNTTVNGVSVNEGGENKKPKLRDFEENGKSPSSKKSIGQDTSRIDETSSSDEDGSFLDTSRDPSIQNGNGHAIPVSRTLCGSTVDPDFTFLERAKYIPLRLSEAERKSLRLLEGALNVSQYTDVVDVLSYSRLKTKQRIHSQIVDLCSVLSGLYVASDYAAGQELIASRDFAANEEWFQAAFEIGRRHKIANPEKMRSTYGKLVFLLQDSQSEDIARMLDFSCIRPLQTVGLFLESRDGIGLLKDPLMDTATQEIIPDGKSRAVIQRQIREKEHAVEVLAQRYRSKTVSSDDIRQCLYSIGDNNAYLRSNRDPCDILLQLLVKYFQPSKDIDKRSSLAIRAGHQGARLTHDHSRQFQYCLQSLTLWREICQHMYKLWYMAESDLFDSSNVYHLRNTGQGLNRVQAAPRVARVMHNILSTVQAKVGTWIGSSVIHLGDSMVPNGLAFIDKYAQLSRILLPLTTVIRRLEDVTAEDEGVAKYVKDRFGGVDNARRIILQDFFRFAFDGSGGTNMFDSGACVDGRLTSCWNWGSSIEKKPYFPLFLLCGFTGFDGSSFD